MKSFVATLVASVLLASASPLVAAGNKSQHNGPSHESGSMSNNSPKSYTPSMPSGIQRSTSPTRFGNSTNIHTDYRFAHGTRCEFGYKYEGRSHYHWTYTCFWERYGCYVYYCPSACCYYYWCQPQNCYLPVTAATTYAPTTGAPLIEIQNNNNNVNTVGAGPVQATVPATVGSELPRSAATVTNLATIQKTGRIDFASMRPVRVDDADALAPIGLTDLVGVVFVPASG